MNTLRELLGLRIKELRLSKNLKQAQLAEIIGIEPRSVSKIESGFHFPKDEHLLKIATALEVEVKDLFMTSHIKNNDELILEINTLLKTADKENLVRIYRVIETLLK